MNDLLSLAINAQGGVVRWRQFCTVSAHLLVGGDLETHNTMRGNRVN